MPQITRKSGKPIEIKKVVISATREIDKHKVQ